ncbi:hypothetical protein [Streptomyces solicathayae]|uniref:DNA primase n=1 Tax=Streptomyces solicathayae TaxID=3081768 RepID=A0ABZ0LNN8_9ACTN|nr:hypothetical protein [Streptomyces sp. HUAS YS2]WOX21061.1 hypothetical protein R2D22_06525 [Streptomyces sp. HUAS YS2]
MYTQDITPETPPGSGERLLFDRPLPNGPADEITPDGELERLVSEHWAAEKERLQTQRLREQLVSIQLPEEFWNAHPTLTEIRAAARARFLGPDAVLGALLARMAGYVNPQAVHVDTGVSDTSTLNLLTAAVGPPGASKSESCAFSGQLIPAAHFPYVQLGNVGSGEGIAETYMGDLETGETGRNGKPVKERRQRFYSAFLEADEGEILSKLGERSGSTLGVTLRTAFTGGALGQKNASRERSRDVRGYALGLYMAFQPETVRPLLAEKAQGTPQRVLFLSATDPNAPDVPVQSTLPGTGEDAHRARTPSCEELARRLTANAQTAACGFRVLTFPAVVVQEVRAARLAGLRGDAQTDGHRTYLRLKVAALLTLLLDGTADRVPAAYWELSGQMTATSDAVRAHLEREAAAEVRAAAEAARQAHADREVYADHERHYARLHRLAERVRKYAAEAGPEGVGVAGRGGLRTRVAAKERGLLPEALEYAQERGWVTVAATGDHVQIRHP